MLNLSRSLMTYLMITHSPGVRLGIFRCFNMHSWTASFRRSSLFRNKRVEFHLVDTSATRVSSVILSNSSVATLDLRKVLTMHLAFCRIGLSFSSFSKARTAVCSRWIAQLWRLMLKWRLYLFIYYYKVDVFRFVVWEGIWCLKLFIRKHIIKLR